jgi:hypothetical protein
MIKRTAKNIRAHIHWAAGIFVLLVLLAIPLLPATVTPAPTATPTPTPGQIRLTANGYKVKGQHTVDLTWPEGTSSNVDVYRNGVLIATVPKIPGFYTDHIGAKGRGNLHVQGVRSGHSELL